MEDVEDEPSPDRQANCERESSEHSPYEKHRSALWQKEHRQPESDSSSTVVIGGTQERSHISSIRRVPGSENVYISEEQGNRVEPSEKSSQQDGQDIHIYYCKVANVMPNRVLEAVFSYTILAERRELREVQDEVELLGRLVSEAIFSNGPQ